MIYPKRKKVLKAASGLNTDTIEQVDQSIISAAKIIPGVGEAVSAGLQIGKSIGEAVSGNGTSGVRNAIGNVINPLSKINSILSGRPAEAIPIWGGFIKAKRMQKEQRKAALQGQARDIKSMNQASNEMFSRLTLEDGGMLPPGEESPNPAQERAVILGGKTHEKGGNDIIDLETGEKVAETEAGELLFTRDQTKQIESLIAAYDQTRDAERLLDLGAMIKEIVDRKMDDFSKRKR